MGQKVHPLGFRVGITKKHQSQWFAPFHKYKYAQTVLEDRMLRETLTNLFPQLLNPVLKRKRDSQDELSIAPKITQIKIERGLIPYEIVIQIHAENCNLIKSSIENLTVNRDLLCQLQKTRRYLQHLRLKLNNLVSKNPKNFVTSLAAVPCPSPFGARATGSVEVNLKEANLSLPSPEGARERKVCGPQAKSKKTKESFFISKFIRSKSRQKRYLTKDELRHQRFVLKRLKKRQSIRQRYGNFVGKNIFLTKKANLLKIVLLSPKFNFSLLQSTIKNKDKGNFGLREVLIKGQREKKLLPPLFKKQILKNLPLWPAARRAKANVFKYEGVSNQKVIVKQQSNSRSKMPANIFQSRIKKKFLSIFINRMNKKFLQNLKMLLSSFVHSTLNPNKTNVNSFTSSKDTESLNLSKRSINTLKSNLISDNKIKLQEIQIAKLNFPNSPIKENSFGSSNFAQNRFFKKHNFLKNLLLQRNSLDQQYKILSQLSKFLFILEEKAFKKMETLRKNFITFASIPKTEAFNYYELLILLKQVKELISQIKRKNKFSLTFALPSLRSPNGARQVSPFNRSEEARTAGPAHTAPFSAPSEQGKGPNLTLSKTGMRSQSVSVSSSTKIHSTLKENSTLNIGQIDLPNFYAKEMNQSYLDNLLNSGHNFKGIKLNLLLKKLNNIDNECRKIKFIEYLKGIVKKHRNNNIYLYLSTISDARKDLHKLQQFTKRNASFLFGLNTSSPEETNNQNEALTKTQIADRISNVLYEINKKSFNLTYSTDLLSSTNMLDSNKTLSEVFLEQIEKQRKMLKHNVQLAPKIAIKFYSVNAKTVKAKASVVTDSIVDALEKRKAFRKVIKDAKEELMRTPGIKGVKIQVAGRLNGAEIARSEWVRAGRVPLQTLRANLDYCYKTASTIYGIIGIKVWIFKGYTKLL